MAKRFRFNLETVLKVRRQKEDEKKRIVAGRLREITQLQERKGSLNQHIASTIELARASIQQPHLDVGLLSRQRYWISHLQRGVLETELQVAKLQEQLRKDRLALVEAAKEVRVIEKLREKMLEKYHQELNRLENVEADEMATQRFIYHRAGLLR